MCCINKNDFPKKTFIKLTGFGNSQNQKMCIFYYYTLNIISIIILNTKLNYLPNDLNVIFVIAFFCQFSIQKIYRTADPLTTG